MKLVHTSASSGVVTERHNTFGILATVKTVHKQVLLSVKKVKHLV